MKKNIIIAITMILSILLVLTACQKEKEEEHNYTLDTALERLESEKQTISQADSQSATWYNTEELEIGDGKISSLTQEVLDLAKETGMLVAQYTTKEGRKATVMKADLTELKDDGESEEVLSFISDLVSAIGVYDMKEKGLTTSDIASSALDMLNGDSESLSKLNDLVGDVTKIPSYVNK